MSFLKKARLPKIPVVTLYTDNTFTEKKVAFDRNKLQLGTDGVRFKPKSVFVKRKRIGKIRPSDIKIFLVDGATEAIQFKADETGLDPYWTQAEAKQFTWRMLQKAMERLKPMTWNMVIILLVVLGILGFITIKTALHVGAL